MTNIWGPMGWMTLHSVSFLYPEYPTLTDKQILARYVDLFRETLSCPYCHKHFTIMFNNYTQQNPDWADSRYKFFLFVVRMHNTVNNRLSKPKPSTIQECIDTYKRNTQITPGFVYRQKYLEYLAHNWGKELNGEAFMRLTQVRELRRITEEYWNRKTDDSTSSFDMNGNVLALIADNHGGASNKAVIGTLAYASSHMVQVGFKGGRLRLRGT